MKSFVSLKSTFAVLPQSDIDTDQIIPAKFLTTTERSGLGEHLFHHWRFDDDGQERADFPLNHPQYRNARVLVAGHNFGCGSSREHAPWALLDFGIQVVISTQIADIFTGNCLKNGLLPIVVAAQLHEKLLANAGSKISVSLHDNELKLWDGSVYQFAIDDFSRNCLLKGIDQMEFLLSHQQDIENFEAQRT